MNGRPGKPLDSCYLWWVLASLNLLGFQINDLTSCKLKRFGLSCTNKLVGGNKRGLGLRLRLGLGLEFRLGLGLG